MILEKLLISYLIDKTSALGNVYAERPNDPPDRYILIEKTGSSVEDMIYSSTAS